MSKFIDRWFYRFMQLENLNEEITLYQLILKNKIKYSNNN